MATYDENNQADEHTTARDGNRATVNAATNSIRQHSTPGLPALSTMSHIAYPTPPYTPATNGTNNTSHVFPEPQDYHNYGNDYFEENNNMDENSNDQEYDRYSHYHEQHFLSQQQQPTQPQPGASDERSAQGIDSWNELDSTNNHQTNGSYELHSSFSRDSSGDNDASSSPTLSAVQRSVRARTPRPQDYRRMSLTPQSTFSSEQQEQQQQQRLHELHRRSLQPCPDDADHDSSFHRSTATGSDERDEVSPQIARRRTISRTNRTHHRNSSFDSGLAELREEERRQAVYAQDCSFQRLPPRYSPSGGLPPLPGATRTGRESETERDAELLLYHFTQEELRREQLSLPSDIALRQSLSDVKLFRAGSELRRLADAFAATAARNEVRCMAEKVLFSEITWENFSSLCLQLFSGTSGITVERIVALFTFISDIAKLQIKRGGGVWLRQLMEWSLRFIVEKVCSWVHNAGGWGRVLHQGLDLVYKVAMTVAAIVGVVAMTAYVTKTIRHW